MSNDGQQPGWNGGWTPDQGNTGGPSGQWGASQPSAPQYGGDPASQASANNPWNPQGQQPQGQWG